MAEDHSTVKGPLLLQRSARGNDEEGWKPEEGCLQLIFLSLFCLFVISEKVKEEGKLVS